MAHYPSLRNSVTRGRKSGVYVVRAKREWVSANWLQNREDGDAGAVAELDEEWKRGEEVEWKGRGTTIVKWYWTNEAIKSLASKRASVVAGPARVAGKPVMLSENYDVTVFAEKQTGSVGKTRNRY